MDNKAYQLYQDILALFWRLVLIVLGIVILIYIFPYVKNILMMIIIALIFATILTPVVNFLESMGVPQGIAILINILFVLGLIVLAISRAIPALISTVENLSAALQSGYLTNFEEHISKLVPKTIDASQISSRIIAQINNLIVNIISGLGSFLKSVGSIFATIAIIPLFTFFLLKDKRKIVQGFIDIVPNKYFELSLNIIYKIGNKISKYLVGKVIQSAIVAFLSIAGLFIINQLFNNPVPPYITIGIIAGLANMIPYVGPVVGAIPALIIAMLNVQTNLFTVLVWISIVFVIVQTLDASVIAPLVVSKSVNLHPITVVAVIIIGGKVAGILGMFLGVPAAGIVKVIISQISWGLKAYHLKELQPSKSSRLNT
ncbi:MAG: AI-2E family transporter [Candidatus Marinimicrobia bacterium]|nr:AI-2E family transporter [Candidatus Neomarinimicrobiota bacterium]